MLRRLEWIKDCAIFRDYRWDGSLNDLQRITVVYGHNGSGKTSLARALDRAVMTLEGRRKVSLYVEGNDGSTRSTDGGDDPIFNRLLVFSPEYVERNHRLGVDGPSTAAVLTVGERAADSEVRLEALRNAQEALIAERDAAISTIAEAEGRRNKVYEQVSKTVVTDLQRAGGPYQSRGSYSIAKVKGKFAGPRTAWVQLPDDGLGAKKHLVNSDNRDSLLLGSFSFAPANTLAQRAGELLAKTPVTIVLDTLRSHPQAEPWVQEGQRLHTDLDQCVFCGSPLTGERRLVIEQHFSGEVERLQHGLSDLMSDLDNLDRQGDAILRRIPSRGLLFEDLRDRFDKAESDVRHQVKALKSWAQELRVRVGAKRANTLSTVDAIVDDAPAVEGAELEAVRDEHNHRVASYTELVQDAARHVELHHLKSAEAEADDVTEAIAVATRKRDAAIAGFTEAAQEVTALENIEGDPIPSAQVLTREVARLLGRDELKFEAVGGRYSVTRDGHPATDLSTGERTAITLVHFLECVARFDSSNDNPIVIIDDPVSSLDSNVFMGVSTYIWSKTVSDGHAEQVILLTHNFELFRQWHVQIEGLHKGNLGKHYPASLFELRSRHVQVGGKARRQPILTNWPENKSHRLKIRSSYHHAFLALVDARRGLAAGGSLEARLDAQLLFPNVIRRVLESFLAFKHPERIGDFTAGMRDTEVLLRDAGYQGDAAALRQQLTRFAHTYSHSDTPETDTIVNPDEIEVAIDAVFTFMKHLDDRHFNGLCKALDVDPTELLSGSGAVDCRED